ncbi:MAG: DUF2237 domain-containing protein [Pseudomonadota bacterium]
MAKNILGEELQVCGCDPMTGWTRNGSCETGAQDHGNHTICAVMTEEFLRYTQERGNDLSTPRPEFRFPGLKPGDRWCLCASRWEEAREVGKAPPVILAACHEKALEVVDLNLLKAHRGDQ